MSATCSRFTAAATSADRVFASGLNHISLRTDNVEQTAAFYRDLLDLEIRAPQTSVTPSGSLWLCDSRGTAIIHLRFSDVPPESGGAVDHIAINCTGRAAIIARLERMELLFGQYDGLMPGMSQLFVRGPQNLQLELVFSDLDEQL